MPVTVRCAVCEAQITLRTSREVYGGADPFPDDVVQGVADTRRTGWRACGPLGGGALYFCPAHADEPAAYQVRLHAWQEQCSAEAQAAAKRWAVANPAPLPGWKAWDRPAATVPVFDGPFSALQEEE